MFDHRPAVQLEGARQKERRLIEAVVAGGDQNIDELGRGELDRRPRLHRRRRWVDRLRGGADPGGRGVEADRQGTRDEDRPPTTYVYVQAGTYSVGVDQVRVLAAGDGELALEVDLHRVHARVDRDRIKPLRKQAVLGQEDARDVLRSGSAGLHVGHLEIGEDEVGVARGRRLHRPAHAERIRRRRIVAEIAV